MVFLTVVMIALYVIMLFRGNPLAELVIKVGEAEIKNAETGIKNDVTDTNYKIAAIGCLFIFLLFLQVIYLILDIGHDVYKYPTIVVISYVILTFALMRKGSKRDLTTEEGRQQFRKSLYQRNRRYTLRGTLIQILYISYFAYMFYLLVF